MTKTLLAAKANTKIKNNFGDNAFFKAVSSGNTELVRILLDAGVDINDKDKYNKTGLMNAITYGYDGIAELLINKCNDLNIADFNGESAVIYAVKYNKLNLIPLMIEKGSEFKSPKVNLLHEYLYNYILNYIKYRPLPASERPPVNLKLIKYLLEKGVDVNYKDVFEETILSNATQIGDVELIELLLLNGADPNTEIKYFKIALGTAAVYGHYDIFKMLYRCTKLDAPDIQAELICWAACGKNLNILKFLLDHGYNVNARNKFSDLLIGKP